MKRKNFEFFLFEIKFDSLKWKGKKMIIKNSYEIFLQRNEQYIRGYF